MEDGVYVFCYLIVEVNVGKELMNEVVYVLLGLENF